MGEVNKLQLVCEDRMIKDKLQEFVDAQAEDEGLWFFAKYITETYLQEALLNLHHEIEIRTEEE